MAKKSNIIKFLHPQKFSTREKNRCAFCGRNRGFYRRFSLCRLCLRALAHKGELPGVVKASW